jgi:maltooligosyltrehalose trehalohydrolase
MKSSAARHGIDRQARRNEWLHLHRDLIHLRRTDPVIARQQISQLDGAVLRSRAFLLRWWNVAHGDRLLIVNLGTELILDPAPEPLLAPPINDEWRLVCSSDDVRYGRRARRSAQR